MGSLRRRSMNPPLPQIAEEDAAEPFRRDIDVALGIVADRPPRNAFAEEGIKNHRHRLAGNAFYQEQFAQRKNTPPTAIHPALRYGTDLYDITQALPELDSNMTVHRPSFEMQEVSPGRAQNPRDTTMTQFINNGIVERVPSPPLKLVPSPQTVHPTLRNMYDEHATDGGQQDGSGADGYYTTTRYSPKVAGRQEFGHQSQQFEPSGDRKVPASPKKSFLDRFRPSNRGGGVPLQNMPSMEATEGAPKMPVKARQILVATPASSSVARSPSKTKGFWSRRKPSVDGAGGRHDTETVLKAPPRAAHASLDSDGLPGFSRPHSLGYLDDSVPPTPPSKDTPPEEKARRESAGTTTTLQEDPTPTRKNGFMSLTDRVSPDKYGGYGQRGNPKLVNQASTQSLRASVVPSVMDGQDFSDTEDRINGLGVEGVSVRRGSRRETFAYSPSIYSPDMAGESMATFPSSVQVHRHMQSESSSSTGISDLGDIAIVYPDLARDPSITSFMTPNKIVLDANSINSRHRSYPETLREEWLPTLRRGDIDIVLHEVDDMLRGAQPSPSNSSLFAIPPGHASAQVSPLHFQSATFDQQEEQQVSSDLQPVLLNSHGYQILPATTYNAWDVQQQSNHPPPREPGSSPGREPRFARDEKAPKTTITHKKNTAAMPGLRYDSGVDVDPQKQVAKQSTNSKPSRPKTPPRPSTSRKENQKDKTSVRAEILRAAERRPIDALGEGDNSVNDLIASYQQSENVNKRLSNLEQSAKQDAAEERRRLEQEVLFDQRIASLEISRFSQEPSPTNVYDSSVPLSRHGSYRKTPSPSHAVADRKKMRKPPALPPTQAPELRSRTKRVSTGEAKDFYQNQLRDSPVRNAGNTDTSTDRAHTSTSSSGSSDTLRLEAATASPQEKVSSKESETIRQLQKKVNRQNEFMQAMAERMADLEMKLESKDSGRG